MRRREPRQTPEVDLPASFSIPFDAFLDVTEELIDAAKAQPTGGRNTVKTSGGNEVTTSAR